VTVASAAIALSNLEALATTADALQTLQSSLDFAAAGFVDTTNLANVACPGVAEVHEVLVLVHASAVAACNLGAEA